MKHLHKIFFTLNVLLTIAVFIGNYFYTTGGELLVKGLTSGGFALMGLLNLGYAILRKYKNFKFHIAMSIGLILAMLGDIMLGKDFVIGASLFAGGHILYLTAYCMLEKPNRIDLIVCGALCILVGAFVLFAPVFTFTDGTMKLVCTVYAVIISLMVGKATSNFIRNRSVLNAILMIGGILFFVSDLMLALDWFTSLGDWTGKLCLATYYPAECILAYSGFHAVEANRNKESEVQTCA